MDILEELPVDKWPLLQDKLKTLWPLNLPGYYTLHINLKNAGIREAFQFKVYCPYGNMDNGFVAINVKDHPDIIIFSITEDTSKIEEAVLKTNLINWSKLVFFDLLTSLTLPVMERVRKDKRTKNFHVGIAKTYYLPGTTEPFKDLRIPANTYLSAVKPEHIHRVDDTWPYKYSYSHTYFTILASNGLSYGLYSCSTNQLLAWIFLNEYNFLCHLYCEEEFRLLGYGEFLMKTAVNSLLEDNHDVYGYVIDGNEKPLKIFAKLGFKAIDDAGYAYME